MAVGEYSDPHSRTQAAKERFLRQEPPSTTTNSSSSSTSTSVDGLQSSSSSELAPSNSSIPLTNNGALADPLRPPPYAAEETSRLTNGQKTRTNLENPRRKRSTTALLLKPSTWTLQWRKVADRLCGRSLDGGKKAPRFRLPACPNKATSSNCLMAFGACVSFVLIISAYLMGRFITSAYDDCPANRYQENGDKSYLDYAYALLRDQLVVSRKSKLNNRLTPIVRLGRDVIPVHYDAHLDLTELGNRKIRGSVRISINCVFATDTFLLHASHEHLNISKITIAKSDKRLSQSLVHWNKTSEGMGGDGVSTVLLTFDTPLAPGVRYELGVVYTATICNARSGVNCHEGDQRGHSSHSNMFASTKFEPTAARTLVPCFDEPDLKATFNVTIVRLSDMVVITNSPSWKRVRTRHAQVIEHFESTPPMSTYLLGFVAGPYVRQEKRTERGVRVAVWTRREDRTKGEYALEYASQMLRVMEHYFSINYHLPKLDLVAAPNYPVGAMENWGLLIFHQRALLYVDEYRLIGNGPDGHQLYQPHLPPKFHTSKIVIHELLHQWFGNLATMHWWSEIWLNEGFATFFIYHFLKEDFPLLVEFHQTWKVIDAWHRQTASTLWSEHVYQGFKPENYTLVRNFSNDEEIYEAFDEHHLYAKGGAVVRMLWHLLGENAMRTGLITYLSANAFRSVDRWELWKYLEYNIPGSARKANGTRRGALGELVESWLTNPGFPEVKITRPSSGSPGSVSGTFSLEQTIADIRLHCSYISADSLRSQTGSWLWSIPLSYTMEENPLRPNPSALQGEPFWLLNRTQTFTDPALTSGQWLLANPDFQFPYRVNYDLDNWSKLTRQLHRRPDRIPLKSRVQLIVDSAFFLKETDDLPYFLDILGYLRKETDLLPLILGLREVFSILDQYKASSIQPLLVFYFRPVVEHATKIRSISDRDSELDAVWWLDDSFQLTLKLLQCITRHRQCHISREEVQSVLSLPSNGQVTDKLIPICEYLKRNFSRTEHEILLYWLDQQRTQHTNSRLGAAADTWRQDIVFMVACVHDRVLIKKLIDVALARGDLELLATSLSSTFNLNYNDFLATELWSRLANASIGISSNRLSTETHLQNMLRSVRTVSELELARRSLSAIDFDHADEISFVETRLAWQERRTSALEDWLMEKLELKQG